MKRIVALLAAVAAASALAFGCGTLESSPASSAPADSDGGLEASSDDDAAVDADDDADDGSQGSPSTNLAPDAGSAYGLAVSGGFVYFTYRDALGAIRRVPVGGGAVETLFTGRTSPVDIAVAGSTRFWVEEGNAGNLFAEDGSGPGSLGAIVKTGRVATDGSKVLWSSLGSPTGYVRSAGLDGGSPVDVPGSQTSPGAVALAGGWSYWATADTTAGHVQRWDGNATETQGSAAIGGSFATIDSLAASATTVAWTSASGVFLCDASSAGFVAVASTVDPLTDGHGVVVDGDDVYYLAGGKLKKKTKGELPARALATVCPSYRSLAADATSLYWTCEDGGVFTRPKSP